MAFSGSLGNFFATAFQSSTTSGVPQAGCILLGLGILLTYRLHLSPIARFPGPKLAALTFLYEFYYDVWQEGQYTWKIRDLHDKYGPFVRINPHEVHCNDPEFFDVLYVGSAKRRTNKSMWLVRQSWTRDSTFKTIEHDLHKQRRNQLGLFFAKASIRTLEPLIVHKVNRLCARLEESSNANGAVSLTHAFVALTVDIISRVCFGFSYECLELEEFAREWHKTMVSSSRTVHLVRQFPWIAKLAGWLPKLTSQATTEGLLNAKKHQLEFAQQVKAVVDRHARGEKPPDDALTVFDSMLDADVPLHEKTVARLSEEAQALIAAGSLTTSNALDTTTYYLLANSACMARLQEELRVAIPDPAVLASVAKLETLPYLTAVIHEGLRLSKSIPHPLARVSPDVSYRYGEVIIPQGVAVSMTPIDILENPEIFPDPHSFIPERWLPLDAPEVRHRRKHLVVFGGGTRGCLGLNLAWAELYLAIAAVVRRFGDRMRLQGVVFERDVKITVNGFNALTSRESKGLRVISDAKHKD